MADIPSFFNKPDFLGALLPGYIAVILGLIIIFPEINPIKNNTGIQPDFFSAVVFLVAGPAVGYTLRQIQVIFMSFSSGDLWQYGASKEKAEERFIYMSHKLNEAERNDLDMSRARYYFNTSTGLVLLMAGGYFSYLHGISLEWGSIPLLILASILFTGAYVELVMVTGPTLKALNKKYAREDGSDVK